MSDQIVSKQVVSRAYAINRARRDFEAGIHECPFNPNSAAAVDWLAEMSRLRRLHYVASHIVVHGAEQGAA